MPLAACPLLSLSKTAQHMAHCASTGVTIKAILYNSARLITLGSYTLSQKIKIFIDRNAS